MDFFASVETEKIPIFGAESGYWLEVKKELTAGDAKKISISGLIRRVSGRQDQDFEVNTPVFDVDLQAAAFNKIAVWLVDWNIPGPDGKTVGITTPKEKIDALRNLKADKFEEVERAIDAYVASRQEKKVLPNSST